MKNFFDILQEAKNPTSKPITIKVQEEKTTDYTEDVEEENEEETPEENTDGNKQENEDTTDETSDEQTDDESSEEDTDESTEDEPTDYTDGVNDDGDESFDDTSSDESDTGEENLSPEEQEDAKKNARLIKNCILLYYNLIGTINRLEKLNGIDIETNKIIIQVKTNLNDLAIKMYDFIILTFNSNGYVKNLYIYNFFIEGFKINIEMLRKINTLENIS